MSGMIMLLLGPLIFEYTEIGERGAGVICMALGYSFVAASHVGLNIDQVPKKDEDED